MDVVIDFAGMAAGDKIILRNDDPTPPLLPSIMQFIVTANPGYTGDIAPTLRTVDPMPESSADNTRYFRFEKDPLRSQIEGATVPRGTAPHANPNLEV